MLLSLNVFGEETLFSWVPEGLLRPFFYRDLYDLSPPPNGKGIFTDTLMVKDDVLDLVHNGKASWLRGDIIVFDDSGTGIHFNKRSHGVPKGGPVAKNSSKPTLSSWRRATTGRA